MREKTRFVGISLVVICLAEFGISRDAAVGEPGSSIVGDLSRLNQSALTIGEVRLWAGMAEKIPPGWCPCDGRLLSPDEYRELFTVLDYVYGKEGKQFRLPDFKNRSPIGSEATSGAPKTSVEDPNGKETKLTGGQAIMVLDVRHLPSHSHSIDGVISHNGCHPKPTEHNAMNGMGCWKVNFGAQTGSTGNGTGFSILDPYVATTFIIYTGRLCN
jgi:microcystin-dependent protein